MEHDELTAAEAAVIKESQITGLGALALAGLFLAATTLFSPEAKSARVDAETPVITTTAPVPDTQM